MAESYAAKSTAKPVRANPKAKAPDKGLPLAGDWFTIMSVPSETTAARSAVVVFLLTA